MRYMTVWMCAGENMLYLLVRRKILRLYRLARLERGPDKLPMKVCTNKVETQNLASHELALRDMTARMCANESVYK